VLRGHDWRAAEGRIAPRGRGHQEVPYGLSGPTLDRAPGLNRLRVMLGLSYLLLSHDLTTVEHMSDWLGMMYLVKLVEFVYPCMPPWAVCTFAES
jgi:hypothetical protein